MTIGAVQVPTPKKARNSGEADIETGLFGERIREVWLVASDDLVECPHPGRVGKAESMTLSATIHQRGEPDSSSGASSAKQGWWSWVWHRTRVAWRWMTPAVQWTQRINQVIVTARAVRFMARLARQMPGWSTWWFDQPWQAEFAEAARPADLVPDPSRWVVVLNRLEIVEAMLPTVWFDSLAAFVLLAVEPIDVGGDIEEVGALADRGDRAAGN